MIIVDNLTLLSVQNLTQQLINTVLLGILLVIFNGRMQYAPTKKIFSSNSHFNKLLKIYLRILFNDCCCRGAACPRPGRPQRSPLRNCKFKIFWILKIDSLKI